MTDLSQPPGEPERQPAFPPPPPAFPPAFPPAPPAFPPPPPPSGYTVAPQVHLPIVDPLVSPDFGGWWRRGMAIVKGGWKQLAALQAAGLVLVLLFEAPLGVYAALETERINRRLANVDPDSAALPDFGPIFALFGLTLLGVLAGLLVGAIVTLACVHIGATVAIGGEPRIGDALRLGVRRVLPLIGWQLLALPVYLAAVCLCLLPVFYIAAVFLVLPVVVAVERTNAFGRCFSLFHANFGTAAARCATILGITIGVSVLGGLIGSGLDLAARAGSPGDTGVIVGSVAATLVAGVVSGAVAILLAPLTLTAYADMRAQREPTHGLTIAHELGLVPSTATP